MSSKKKTVAIIGAGRVGTALGILFQQHAVFTIGQVFSRSAERARQAVAQIGAGEPALLSAGGASGYFNGAAERAVQRADLYLMAVPDDQIRKVDQWLAASGTVDNESIVFHCSGSLSSDELSHSVLAGAAIASVHPVMTFAQAAEAARCFKGVSCAIEGDDQACGCLAPAFEQIGGITFRIEAESKPLYHAALVFAANYLHALLNISERLLVTAGIPSSGALPMIRPLVEASVRNAFEFGLPQALTGPIARGDARVVQSHIDELTALDPQLSLLYRFLGLEAAKLAAQLDREKAGLVRQLLEN